MKNDKLGFIGERERTREVAFLKKSSAKNFCKRFAAHAVKMYCKLKETIALSHFGFPLASERKRGAQASKSLKENEFSF